MNRREKLLLLMICLIGICYCTARLMYYDKEFVSNFLTAISAVGTMLAAFSAYIATLQASRSAKDARDSEKNKLMAERAKIKSDLIAEAVELQKVPTGNAGMHLASAYLSLKDLGFSIEEFEEMYKRVARITKTNFGETTIRGLVEKLDRDI